MTCMYRETFTFSGLHFTLKVVSPAGTELTT